MGAQGYWLNKRRLTVYSRLCVAMYVVGLLFWLIARVWLAETPFTTLRNDFAGLWSVGHMVLQGRASEAYLPDLALAAEAAFVPEHEVRLPWFYPPPRPPGRDRAGKPRLPGSVSLCTWSACSSG